jgi:hypothetical protein
LNRKVAKFAGDITDTDYGDPLADQYSVDQWFGNLRLKKD